MKAFLLIALCMVMVSCATIQGTKDTPDGSPQTGVWHRVQEGQTLWRIAKTYQITLEELKEANDLIDTMHISTGTWLFVPKAKKVLYVQGNLSSLPPESAALDFVWPLKGDVVRSFGKSKNDFNYGIDLKTSEDRTVVASEKGRVILAGAIRGYGNTIIIEHESDFCSLYARNIESLVKEGQQVEKNSIIARAGTGKASENNTLHYELFYKGKPVNPLYYLP